MSRNAQFQFVLLALATWLLPARAMDLFPLPATNQMAHVVIAQDENLLDAYLPNEARVETVFNSGLLALTGKTDVTTAWRSLVKSNDTVGIKVFSLPGPISGTRPAIVAAMVRGLLAAGIPANQIVIWDKNAVLLREAGFTDLARQLGVRAAGATEAGYDEKTFYLPDSPVIGTLVWGDLEFGKTDHGIGKKSFVSKLVSQQLTKIISVAPLISENAAGTCGHFYSLTLASVDNTRRFESDPDRLAVALPEIYALPSVGDKVTLLVTDALLSQYQGGPASFVQFSTELDQLWLSHDPVALDVMALKELVHERNLYKMPPMPSNYLIYTNAALLQLGNNDLSRIRVDRVK